MHTYSTGSQFTCLLDIVPIKNEKREVVLFLASHKEIHPPRDKSVLVGKSSSHLTINNKGFSNSLTVPGFDNGSDEDTGDEGSYHSNGLLVTFLTNYLSFNYKVLLCYKLSLIHEQCFKSQNNKISITCISFLLLEVLPGIGFR